MVVRNLDSGRHQGLQGEQEFNVQEPALFLRGRLNEGLYYRHKGKEYAMEVVTTAEKLQPDNLKDIKDSLDNA